MISSRKEKNVSEALAELRSEVGGGAGTIEGMVCHVGKAEDRQRLVQHTVDSFGGIDILVSNAGTNPTFGPILNVSDYGFFFISVLKLWRNFLVGVWLDRHPETINFRGYNEH